jgi:hypothetical protein
MSQEPPPPALDCARVLEYVFIPPSNAYSGRTLLFVDGKEIGRVPRLAICEERSSGRVLLFHCDDEWNVLGCAVYDSVAKAKNKAEWIYPGLLPSWAESGVSEVEAERYLDELFANERCSFCGKRADRVNQLFSRDSVFICDGCVDEFHRTLHNPVTPTEDGGGE